MSVTVIVTFDTKPDQVDGLSTFLSGLQEGMLEAGCDSVALLHDQDQATRFYEIEHWPSSQAHKEFVKVAAEAGAFKPFDQFLLRPFEVNYLDTVKSSPI